MNKMSLFAVSVMAMVLSCSEKGPFDYPSQRDLEEMAAMSSSSNGGSSSSTEEQSSSSEEVSSSSGEGGSSSSSEEVSSSSSEEGSSSSTGELSSSSEEASSSSSEGGSSSSTEEQSSSSVEASSSSSEGGSSSSLSGCGNYSEENEFCRNNHVYEKCGDGNGNGKHEYDPETQFCYNNYTLGKCNGQEYDPASEQCRLGVVERRCGGYWYVPQTQFCISSTVYDKCGGVSAYTPGVEVCCGTGKYTLASQFCHTDNNVYNKCGGIDYNPSTQYCHNGVTHSCDNKPYNPVTQFCYSDSKIVNYCGARTEEFDPDLYECRETGKIYLKTPVSYGGKSYNAVLIGAQTWMTENLNYAVEGSKCFGEDGVAYGFDDNGNWFTDRLFSPSEVHAYCTKYGRLYDWSTAMNLEPSCNSTLCSGEIQPKHQGICPDGWHIPSQEEWSELLLWVDEQNGGSGYYDYLGSPYSSYTAGRYLKAANAWMCNGTDDYGFFALPGGIGTNGGFNNANQNSHWWGTDENSGYGPQTFVRHMDCDEMERFVWYWNLKERLLSIRCLKD